jgi:putative intracellular protease/amidase
MSLMASVLFLVAAMASPEATRLTPPATGRIPVAFVVTEGAVMIDFAGPWEVFQDVMVRSRGTSMDEQMPFELYTVSDTREPLRTSGGLRITPDYTFDDAPPPRIVVVPAQSGKSPRMLEWLRDRAAQSDVVMSVCTGAFRLAEAGLLKGKKATTHHASYTRLQNEFPDILVQRGMRYVQSDPAVFTAGGLSSGIDLALHVVELYYGRRVAEETARMMEYEGKGWKGTGAAAASFMAHSGPHPSDIVSGGMLGNWEGSLVVGSTKMRVALHVWREPTGALTGTADSLDEDALDLPISGMAWSGSTLHFEIASVGGTFDGTLDAKARTIAGTWKQSEESQPLLLHRPGVSSRSTP